MGLLARLTGTTTTKAKSSNGGQAKPQKSYRCVQVVTGAVDCCKAAQSIAGQRYLSAEAPMFPLKDCDAATCECTYKHYTDRRIDLRRAADVGFDIAGQFVKEENRDGTTTGRRKSD